MMNRNVGEKEADEINFAEGMVFETYGSFLDVLKSWCKKNNHPIKVARSERNSYIDPDFARQKVRFTCKHAGKPRPRGNNLRKQSYYANGCKMQVNVNLIKKPRLSYRVSKVVATHNHATGAEYMKLYPENRIPDKTVATSLEKFFKYDVPTKKIRDYINKTFEKKVSSKDVVNMRYRYKQNNNAEEGDGDAEVLPLLAQLEELADSESSKENHLQIMKVRKQQDSIVLKDKPMKEPATKCPEVLVADGTNKANMEGYYLYSVICEEGNETEDSDLSATQLNNVAMEVCVTQEKLVETSTKPASSTVLHASSFNKPSVQPREHNETPTSKAIEEEHGTHKREEKSIQEAILLSLQQQTNAFQSILQELRDMRNEMGQLKAEEIALKREELAIRREELATLRLRSS